MNASDLSRRCVATGRANTDSIQEEDIARLEALSCMRALGMRLADMKAYLAMASHGKKASRQMLKILERQSARLQERLAETKRFIEYTDLKLVYWRAVEARDERTAAAT